MIDGVISHPKHMVMQRGEQDSGDLYFLPSFATDLSGDLEEIVSTFYAADSIYLSSE